MSTISRWMVFVVVVLLTVSVAAQRGGGGGRGTDRPLNRTSYDSTDYGIRFPVPADMDLYTPDEPGMYTRVFTPGRIVFIVKPQHIEESIGIKIAENVTEADLASYKTAVETNPPQAKMPGFVKIGVAGITIGKDGDRKALNFVYTATQESATQEKMEMTFRQVVFLHKGRGFTITCASQVKHFEKVNKETFDKFLSTIELR